MITMQEVQAQLRRIGFRAGLTGLGRAELNELPKILMPEERLAQVVMGWYKGGMALLCATNQRVVLIDKKMFFLTVEDVRYDMIAEVMYQYRLLDATVILTYAPKSLQFKCWNQGKLRQLASYIQQRVMEKKSYEHQERDLEPAVHSALPSSQGTVAFAPAVNPAYSREALNLPVLERSELPVNPYKSKLPFRRRRVSRFVTSSQMAR